MSQMKNICFLNSTKFWGGGEKIHLDYSLKFKVKGYNVTLGVMQNSPLAKEAKTNGLQTFNIALSNLSFLNPFKYAKLVKFFKSEQIDTVIISSSHDLKVGAIAAKKAGVKNIVYYRVLAAPVKNKMLNRHIYGKVLTHIIANSLETRRGMLRNMPNVINNDDISIVNQGLDIEAIDQQKVVLNEKTDKIIIGNAGRLTAQKGQEKLIDIALQLKAKNLQFKIQIAGTGPDHDKLLALIASNKLQNEVELLGFVKDVNSFMHNIDIFALTSEWEGFGYVLAEAMVAQKPLVAFDITSNPELVENDKNGYLVPFPDTTAFSNKLAELIASEELRKQLGNAGRKVVEDNFQLDKIIGDFEKVVLSQKTTRQK